MLALIGLAAALLAPVSTAAPFDVMAAKAKITAVMDRDYPHLDALYKDIHAHPELAFQETRTAALLAAEMRRLGFEVTEHVGGTGIVALYRNGAGPTVLCGPNSTLCPWRRRPASPTPATSSRSGPSAPASC